MKLAKRFFVWSLSGRTEEIIYFVTLSPDEIGAKGLDSLRILYLARFFGRPDFIGTSSE
ncbi:MAG: hypothetical protein ACOC6R_00685 [Chloroflexota bacterium]